MRRLIPSNRIRWAGKNRCRASGVVVDVGVVGAAAVAVAVAAVVGSGAAIATDAADIAVVVVAVVGVDAAAVTTFFINLYIIKLLFLSQMTVFKGSQ